MRPIQICKKNVKCHFKQSKEKNATDQKAVIVNHFLSNNNQCAMTFNIHWLTFLKTASTIKQRTYSCCLDSKQEITYLDGANLKRKKLQKNYWHEFCIISFSCSINHEIMRYIQNVLDRNKIWKLVTFVLTDNGFETENLKNWGRYLRSPSPSLYKAVHTSLDSTTKWANQLQILLSANEKHTHKMKMQRNVRMCS